MRRVNAVRGIGRTLLLTALVALPALVGFGGKALAEGGASDDGGETVVIEVRIWQHVDDPEDIWLSARPRGGRWDTLGTIPFPLESLWSGYSYLSVHWFRDLPIAGVELRAWQRAPKPVEEVDEDGDDFDDLEAPQVEQRVPEPGSIYVQACASACVQPARVGRSAIRLPAWAPLGKAPLPLDDGHSRSGRYRYGDLTIAVPRGNPGLLADREHLLALRDVFEGGGAELDWNAGTPTARWEGVTVSGSLPRVTGLNLTERGLTGEIWGWLGDLTELTELRLDGNALTGRIPSKLVLVENLTHLYLGGNELEGCVPPPLRTVPNTDLDSLDLPDCPDPDLGLISYGTVPQHPVFGAGTHRAVLNSETPVHIVVDVPTGQSVRFEYYPPGGDQQVDAGELGDIFEAAAIYHEFGVALRDTNDSRTWLFLENETGHEAARNPYSGCVYDCGPGGSPAALVEKLAASVWVNTAIETTLGADTVQTYWQWMWP